MTTQAKKQYLDYGCSFTLATRTWRMFSINPERRKMRPKGTAIGTAATAMGDSIEEKQARNGGFPLLRCHFYAGPRSCLPLDHPSPYYERTPKKIRDILSRSLQGGVLLHKIIFLVYHTVASALTSSGTFPTPSAADDGFYTCSPAPSLLQPLLLYSLCREYLYGPSLIVSQCSAERAQQVLSHCQTIVNPTTATLLLLSFRSTNRPSRSSISVSKVNSRQTFIEVDNTAISSTSGQDLRSSQELDLAGA
ncbi:hypothetical protein BHE74_00021815 [Ensete ventricosum]|nr:hypothetical protein BHE74_00021815 [Ensete ventricosum]